MRNAAIAKTTGRLTSGPAGGLGGARPFAPRPFSQPPDRRPPREAGGRAENPPRLLAAVPLGAAPAGPRPVLQRTKQENITGKGYTDEEADKLKAIVGNSWGNAEAVAVKAQHPLTPESYRKILAWFPGDRKGDRKEQRDVIDNLGAKAFDDLVGRYFDLAKLLELKDAVGSWANTRRAAEAGATLTHLAKVLEDFAGDAVRQRKILTRLGEDQFWELQRFFKPTLEGLIDRGIDNETVTAVLTERRLDEQTLAEVGRHPEVSSIAKLGRVLASYPKFRDLLAAKADSTDGGIQQAVGRVTEAVRVLDDKTLAYLNAKVGADLPRLDQYTRLAKLSSIPGILKDYPSFQLVAEGAVAASRDDLDLAIEWAAAAHADSRKYLEKSKPPLAALAKCQEGGLDTTMVEQLSHLEGLDHPGNDDTEKVDGSVAKYRVGHFVMHHAIRYIDDNSELLGGKTLWPYGTGLADVRAICKEFDEAKSDEFDDFDKKWYFTPGKGGSAAGKKVKFANYWGQTTFDQAYPQSGSMIYSGDYRKIKAVRDLHNDWKAY